MRSHRRFLSRLTRTYDRRRILRCHLPTANNCYTRLLARFPNARGRPSPSPEVMTIDDLAVYLQLSKSSLYKLVQVGRIPGKKIGRHWRFHRGTIDDWLARSEHSRFDRKA